MEDTSNTRDAKSILWSGLIAAAGTVASIALDHGLAITQGLVQCFGHMTTGGAFLLVGLVALGVWLIYAFRRVRAFVHWTGYGQPWSFEHWNSLETKMNAMINQRIKAAVEHRLDALEQKDR